ncbi:MAG TPA: hypothetical protein VF483_04775 [Gemmatimonadaceae bacterium]
MAERRYSEEEVGAIFELATKAQAGGSRQLPSGEGMTLAGLQEIGREVGIPAELVAEAAKALDRQGIERTRRVLGMPIGVGLTVDLGRTMDDAEWEQLVVHLRDTFDASGRVSVQGAFREWRNGNLQVLVEPTPSGSQLRMKTVKSTSISLLSGGAAVLALGVLNTVALAATRGIGPRTITGLLMMGAIGAGVFAFGALGLPGWARLRRQQMQDIANRLTSGKD